jgi:GT2 family glycosyltransferase
MRKKIKLVFSVGKRGIRKLGRGEMRYREISIFTLPLYAIRYGVNKGPKKLIRRIKDEFIQIDRRVGFHLGFPNGLVSGVDQTAISRWYAKNARPLTVVIPSYNDLDVLIPCLESIAATTDPKLVKVIVVDDYCDPQHRKRLSKLENDQVSIIFRERNGGFAKAVNTGLGAANNKQDVVLINSDIVAHLNWVEALQYGAYEFGIDTGIVGAKLLYPDGRIQSAGSYRNTEVPEFFDHYYRFQDSNYGPANIPHYCLAVTGACMYIKREFLNNIGILDEGFSFAFEDVDWCLRGWEAGYRTLYFPSATLTHVESATRQKNIKMSEKEQKSVKYFWQKWESWFDKREVTNKDGKINLIFVLQSFGLSGGIKNVFEQANRLSKRGFSVQIWGLDKNPSPWEISDNIKIRTFKNYDRLIVALSQEKAIKIATWWETAFPVWLSSVTTGVPVYFIQEFETWFYPDNLIAQASVVSCYRKEFHNATISSYNLEEIRSIGLDATILPCGYDDRIYKPLKGVARKNNVILAVGRTFFQKNFAMTLKGWKLLGEKRPKLQLYGFEPEMAKFDKKIEYITKPSNERVNTLLNEAAVFIQTSRHEGFCLPVLEAMAAGCPVITTDSHGNRDFSFNGKNCLIVDQDDAPGLKDAIDRVMKDKKLRERLSKAGIKTARDYKWEIITDKIEDFYKQLAEQYDQSI